MVERALVSHQHDLTLHADVVNVVIVVDVGQVSRAHAKFCRPDPRRDAVQYRTDHQYFINKSTINSTIHDDQNDVCNGYEQRQEWRVGPHHPSGVAVTIRLRGKIYR